MWLASLARDVRIALRGLARRPFYTAVVVVTLSLGIGANTAIFSVVDAVLLRPVAAPALGRLLVARADYLQLNLLDAQFSPGEALDLFARRDLFQAGAAVGGDGATLTGAGDAQRLTGANTMGDFFGLFGVRPYLGRLYGPRESAPGGPHVVVLSYATWRDVFGGDPAVVGRSVELNGQSHEVIGVLPPAFGFPRAAQFYRPQVLDARVLSPQQRGSLYMSPILRLRDGVTAAQARAQLALEVERWRQRFPDGLYKPGQYVLRTVPFVDFLAGQLRPVLLVLAGAVLFVLLIACANVASLQLVRATGRAREMAVRAALGAGRGAIARQVLAESVVLAVAGGACGVLVGLAILRALARLPLGEYRAVQEVHLHGAVLAFTAVVSVAAGLAFGLIPALRVARVDLQETLRDASRGTMGARRHRFLEGSVVTQLALAQLLLLGSALTIRSLARLLDTDPGFRPEQLTTVRVSPPAARYGSGPALLGFYDELLRRVAAIPGVRDAGLTWGLPFADGGTSSPFTLPGRAMPTGTDVKPHAHMLVVAGDYFRTMGIPLLRGRGFAPTVRSDSNLVVVVDQTLARQFFPGEDPVGKRIDQGRPATIVGVVGNVTRGTLGEPPHPTIYYPYAQFSWVASLHLVVRSALPTASVVGQVRAAARAIDRNVALYDIHSMTDRVSQSVGARRLAMVVLSGFAALALGLAVLGIYGVLSYTTQQRTQEIGIRMALGADAPQVVRMVLRSGMRLTFVGLALGVVAFVWAGRALQALLYGVTAFDPATIAGSAALLGVAAVAACWLPARRAARADPVDALRAG